MTTQAIRMLDAAPGGLFETLYARHHPLLRRLGPSPFESSRFPFVGLLATCYDVISKAALMNDDESAPEAEVPAPPAAKPLPGRRTRTIGKAKAVKKAD